MTRTKTVIIIVALGVISWYFVFRSAYRSREGGMDLSKVRKLPVTVDYSLSFDKMVRLGRYDGVSEYMTAANFPIIGSGQSEIEVELLPITKGSTIKDAFLNMDQRDIRPVNTAELLALGAQYPSLQKKRGPIAGLGWVTPLGEFKVPHFLVLKWWDKSFLIKDGSIAPERRELWIQNLNNEIFDNLTLAVTKRESPTSEEHKRLMSKLRGVPDLTEKAKKPLPGSYSAVTALYNSRDPRIQRLSKSMDRPFVISMMPSKGNQSFVFLVVDPKRGTSIEFTLERLIAIITGREDFSPNGRMFLEALTE